MQPADLRSAPIEVELKLAIDPSAAAALRSHPSVRDAVRGARRTDAIVATYFDTPDRRLQRAGVALRVRRIGCRHVMTVKGSPVEDAASGAVSRPEYEWPVPGGEVDTMRLATTPWCALFAKALRRGPLAPAFVTRFSRTSWPLAFADGTTATLSLDQGEIEARARRTPISEVEIELASGDPARIVDLAERLASDLPLAIEPRSKAERGHALAAGERAAPARARDIALAPRATAGEAIAATIAECVRQIERNAVGLREAGSRDPEWIHQLRIGVRRLRSCLTLARALAPPGSLDALRADTRWVLDALGSARDLDVFADLTLPAALADLERASGTDAPLVDAVRTLARRTAAQRQRADAAARSCVASPRFTRFVLASLRTAGTLRGLEAAKGPADRFAAEVIERRARRVAKAGAGLSRAGAEERHALRIASKKLRYATEFFAALFPRKRTRAYRDALEDLQQVLGEWNDTAVAPRIAATIAGPAASAAVAVEALSAARARDMDERLDAVWSRFVSAKPFWTRT